MIHARRLARLLVGVYGNARARVRVSRRLARYARAFTADGDLWVRAEHAERWAYWSLVYTNLRRYF